MTEQTTMRKSLGRSLAVIMIPRLCALALEATLVAALVAAGAFTGFAEDNPQPAKAAPQSVKAAKHVKKEAKPAEPAQHTFGHYLVHQTIELGGRITADKTGSSAMWATMVNQGTGMRFLSEDIQMHSLDPAKTPFFDTLSSTSFGYGGDPNDVSYLNLSKGRLYDFAGSFRRDRNYFDYNLLGNSLLSNPFVPEPDALHLFNTVRRNTDALFTLLPLSRVSFRIGLNHGTHEGPSYSSVHEGGDGQTYMWFRNAEDTYKGGVDVKVAPRSTASYDQFIVLYRGDSWQQLAAADYTLSNGQAVSFGFDNVATTKCNGQALILASGAANPWCNGFTAFSVNAPTRTMFPVEQLRFASRYWQKLVMNSRFTYSGGVSNVNHFNETFTGLTSRTGVVQEIDTGGMPNGRLAHNKHISVNADYDVEAELNSVVTLSDAIHYWDFRNPGSNSVVSSVWTDTNKPPSMLDPVSAITPTASASTNYGDVSQRIAGNTLLAIFTITPEFKLTTGWRYDDRHLIQPDDLQWHQNWLLLGAVMQPSALFRLNLNYDQMNSRHANSTTTSNTYTREAPDKIKHFRVRATVRPAKWMTFAVTGNDYEAENDDPLVNHLDHNHDFSFDANITPTETLSMDFDYAHDSVYSRTDICYYYTGSAPYGDQNGGTCAPSADNPDASSSMLLGNGLYDAPSTFFSSNISYAPVKRVKLNGGAQYSSVNGQAEMLNPLMVPGALQSTMVSPFADVLFQIAPQWSWHGNWQHHGYAENGPAGPAPRDFHGEVVTLGVRYAF